MSISFQLCFGVYHQKGLVKSGGTGIKWNTSHLGLCWWC